MNDDSIIPFLIKKYALYRRYFINDGKDESPRGPKDQSPLSIQDYIIRLQNLKFETTKSFELKNMNDWIDIIQRIQNYKLKYFSLLVRDDLTLQNYLNEIENIKDYISHASIDRNYFQGAFDEKLKEWIQWIQCYHEMFQHQMLQQHQLFKIPNKVYYV